MTRPDDAAIRAAHRAGWEAAMNTLNPSQRAPWPGMPPMRHGVRAPLPTAVRTAADLAHAMRELLDWTGAPSLRQFADHSQGAVPRSTLHDALGGALPKAGLLHDFVKACGAGDDWIFWFKAWTTARDNATQGETA